jgi:PIN domain nuclease of toxin-antitoxin system
LRILPVTLSHVLALENLPHYHRDPFDRLLIAQTIEEKLRLVNMNPTASLRINHRLEGAPSVLKGEEI